MRREPGMRMGRACPGCGREYGPSGECCADDGHWPHEPAPARPRPPELPRELPAPPPPPELAPPPLDEHAQALARARAALDELASTLRALPTKPAKRADATPARDNRERWKNTPHRDGDRQHIDQDDQHARRAWLRSQRRSASTSPLVEESRFLDQQEQAAHRYLLKLVNRIWPETDGEEWIQPLGWKYH